MKRVLWGQLFFKKQFQVDIRSGRKRTTIRRWNKPRVQAGRDAYSPGLGWLTIERVEPIELAALDNEDAVADGFETSVQLSQVLSELYPQQATDGKQWFRVVFSLREPAAPPRARKVSSRSPYQGELWQ